MKFCLSGICLIFLCITISSSAQDTKAEPPGVLVDSHQIEYSNLSDVQIKSLAKQGDAEAQYRLGILYDTSATKSDEAEALKWFEKSAGQGNAKAEGELGAAYYDGNGVPKDTAKGAEWYTKAAKQGDLAAEFLLAGYYQDGDGVPKDPAIAAMWFRRCAEQGNWEAQLTLASCYLDGNGVPKDLVQAYKWASLAHRIRTAQDMIEVLEKSMSAEEVAEGRTLAKDFKPRTALEPGASISRDEILNSNPAAMGTGFFITQDGYLLTNNHVVNEGGQIRLIIGSTTYYAKVIQVDETNDIALLKADGKFSPLPISDSRNVNLGDTVATIGFPDPGLQGFSPKLAKGEIASLSGVADDDRYFQVSVPVQPGNSGGPLVDDEGNVVGIVSAKLDEATALAASGALPENVNYAIKSSVLLTFMEAKPDIKTKLKRPNVADEKFSDTVKSAQDATVLVLVY